MDWPLALILLLLVLTLGAWAAGWFVYPFGLLVLAAATVARILQILAGKKHG